MNKGIRFIAASAQDQGAREEQEDVLIVYNNECIVLADGVGGAPYGKEAAQFIAEQTIRYYKLLKIKPRSWKLKSVVAPRMIKSLNSSLLKEKKRLGITEGMATTMTFFFLFPPKVGVIHIGDSALFAIRNTQIQRITPVHRDPDTGFITQWLGDDIQHTPFLYTQYAQTDDVYVLVSDGIADWIAQEDMLSIITNADPDTACRILIQKAAEHGSTDNKTAALVTFPKTAPQQMHWL